MRASLLVSLVPTLGFLFGCVGCCSGFMEGVNEGLDKDFGPSFKKSFVDSCVPEVKSLPAEQAEAQCGCMADRMLATHTPTELMKLSVSTDSPEFAAMVDDAAKVCVTGAPGAAPAPAQPIGN